MALEVRTLMNGVRFGESPRWHENRLWFSDWGAQEVIAVDVTGDSEVILKVASFPFSIDWLADGRMLIVSASERRLLRREPDGSRVTHADLAGLSSFPWNEIVVDGRDNVYVNNIGFDFSPGAQAGPGSLALVTPDGSTRQVADDVAFPNGMVVTADNSTLILAESYANRLTAFDIAADGSLFNRRVWADLGDGVPDGICIDADNAVWYADVPNKRCVRVRDGGEVMQSIELDRGCFACMLGGPENRTLFMLAREWSGPASAADGSRTGQVLAVEAPAPGAGWP
ncbi:MAG TPA: SMP-30/gluconolactonase/LRE family protein [Solirubrobacteraceae bacterium]|nr:SMP-30/gluconolactonase/LRE family protein [Solirubrobacteraceae bacterium]